MQPLRIAIIGYGKIAQDQHVPSIEANGRFELVATVSRGGEGKDGVPNFASHQEMLAAVPDLHCVAICTPPSVRYEITRDCLNAGLHCLLEKPPGISLGEVEELVRLAKERDLSLFTTWHAQYHPTVTAAAEALAGKRIAAMEIVWHEDVRKWHPGQAWIWEPGGFGVFDPGINALSIASRIFPGILLVRGADLFFPANRQQPIAARIKLASPVADGELSADFDWRHSGGEAWDIHVRTSEGQDLMLGEGGSKLSIDGVALDAEGPGEYPAIYEHFVDLIDTRTSHVDVQPLRITADAFVAGRRTAIEPFED